MVESKRFMAVRKISNLNNKKGITLIALIITIIVLLILAGVTIATLTGDNGLLQKAANSKQANEKGEIEEQIKLAYNEWKLGKEAGNTSKLKDTMETRLTERYGNDVSVSEIGRSVVVNVKNYEVTLIDDGTIEEGKLACLNIADGSIQLKSNGYIQGSNSLVEYTGRYIITGTTTENIVQVTEQGTYHITIKDLNIDVRGSDYSAFNGNVYKSGGWKHYETGVYVNIVLEGNNYLRGGSGPGLAWVGATPNVNGETNGSTLTIDGNGYLEAYGGDGKWTSAIGNTYNYSESGGEVNNILINGGNIKAVGSTNGSGIGSVLHGKANNIVINNGNIEAIGKNFGAGIGTSDAGTADNIVINGGNIIAKSGGHGPGIGGGKDVVESLLKITGGNIYALGGKYNGYNRANTIGQGIKNIIIEGGTIRTDSNIYAGIFKNEENNVKITGGNLQLGGVGDIGSLDSNKSFVQGYSTDGTNTLYKTPIKLQGVGENKKVTKLTTSDNINYGINDMYTLENGMLYLYLPIGERTITIEVDGKTYSGTVATTETPVEVTLNEVN